VGTQETDERSPHVSLTMSGTAGNQSKTLIPQEAFTLVPFNASHGLSRVPRGLRQSVYSDMNQHLDKTFIGRVEGIYIPRMCGL
jgi:hypothetical protein